VWISWDEVYTRTAADLRRQRGSGAGLDQGGVQKIGVNYLYLRARKENDWTRTTSTTSTTDSLRRHVPPIHVMADIRRTRLLGLNPRPREGGVMMVRLPRRHLPDGELKGKKIGLSRSPNRSRPTGGASRRNRHRADAPDERHDRADVQIVEFPYPDDWYDNPR